MLELLYFLISLFSSMIGAISGIGGGVIIKPVLDATGTMSVVTISFLSGCTVLSMAVVSMIKGRNSGVAIDKRKSTGLAIGAAFGGIFGKQIFDVVKTAFANENHVGAIQAVMLLIITVGVFIYIRKKKGIKTHNVESIIICLIIGLLLGVISAFLGIGGGPINIAVLYFFFSMDAKMAARNSLYIILFSQVASLASTLITKTVPEFDVIILALMVAAGVIGGTVGSIISKKINEKKVEQVFTVLLFIIIGVNIFNIFKFMT